MLHSQVEAEDAAIDALADRLSTTLASGDTLSTQRLITRLIADARLHFSHEEQLLEELDYPLAKGHAALHAQLAAELEHAMQELRHTFHQALRSEYGLLIKQLVSEHTAQEASPLRQFLQVKTGS